MDKIITNTLYEGTYTLDDLQAAIDAARAEGGTTVVLLAMAGYEYQAAELEFTTTRPPTEEEIDAELTLPEYLAKHGRARRYEVWSEGYACTGASAGASLLGSVDATSFREACVKLAGDRKDFDEKTLSVWGCRLYDNREDAQRSFG